jgi:hypothetical protein
LNSVTHFSTNSAERAVLFDNHDAMCFRD